MKIQKKILQLGLISMGLIACNSDDKKAPEFGNLNLSIANVVQDKELILNTESYTNASGESYKVSELKYILSDFVFVDKQGNEFEYPKADSYFLINEADTETLSIDFSKVPVGEYTAVKFGFGVDQSKFPIEQGTLNFVPKAEEAQMLWAWAAGYKFIKFEGTYETSENATANDFKIHVGSHGANIDNYKAIILPLNSLVVTKDNIVSGGLKVDIAKVFDAVNKMSLSVKSDVQLDPENSPKYAANIQTMFSVK
ncbi:MbnP family protein [Aquimarina agarilytica]|uniref:MbnP family protein n=1 Tax=Aquimarina agarilytica TaxID=1087449 RepID=UPI0002897D21|nr:MbnP family protein [Aquimarina agarilytica]